MLLFHINIAKSFFFRPDNLLVLPERRNSRRTVVLPRNAAPRGGHHPRAGLRAAAVRTEEGGPALRGQGCRSVGGA